jgi:hypothetical protein
VWVLYKSVGAIRMGLTRSSGIGGQGEEV